MNQGFFTADFQEKPYWQDLCQPIILPTADWENEADVAIIGAGYAGLCAALQIARGGRSVVVFDAGDPGRGCSTRNGGQISTSIKPSYKKLTQRFGKKTAGEIISEGHRSLAWIKEFIIQEQIECGFRVPGRFHAAHTQSEFKKLVNELAEQPEELEIPYHIIPRSEQHCELGTDRYFGGAVLEAHASLDPFKYHRGLLGLVLEAGITVVSNCSVNKLERNGNLFQLNTDHGLLASRNLVVATNGYTGQLTPWLRRRIIPIGSYVIATEPLEPHVLEKLMPSQRVISDTRKVVYYYRPSPDRTRILFGGRVTTGETDLRQSGVLLRKSLIDIFPELQDISISHSWMGFVAYTFDQLPHIGQHDGAHFAMGICGSGVAMASYLGTRVGQQLLGLPEGRTAFDNIEFKTRPFYAGSPWFLPPIVGYYRWRDRIGL